MKYVLLKGHYDNLLIYIIYVLYTSQVFIYIVDVYIYMHIYISFGVDLMLCTGSIFSFGYGTVVMLSHS